MTDDGKIVPINNEVEVARLRLAAFLDRHPDASVAERRKSIVVLKPWGDPTVALRVDPDDEDLINTLNAIYLPPQFSAIWHTDTKGLEFIYTAYPVEESHRAREFIFDFAGKSFRCAFRPSSDRLVQLAVASRPIEAPTDTSHRNLASYYSWHHHRREHPDSDFAKDGAPTSFWVDDIDYEENFLLEFARHLNFFMSYCDPMTPRIVVHRPVPKKSTVISNPTAGPDAFPTRLRGRKMDAYVLGLWESAGNATDPFRRFIYLYQVLEYCAFYYVQDEILRVIRRAISAPAALSNVDAVARDVLDALVGDRMQEPQKLITGIEQCVDPKRLWEMIEPNSNHFAVDATFDGGFELPALIHESWGLDDFRRAWTPKFADSLRKIRNALVHARESRMVGVIAPTHENYEKLAPWLFPLRIAAMDVMLHSSSPQQAPTAV